MSSWILISSFKEQFLNWPTLFIKKKKKIAIGFHFQGHSKLPPVPMYCLFTSSTIAHFGADRNVPVLYLSSFDSSKIYSHMLLPLIGTLQLTTSLLPATVTSPRLTSLYPSGYGLSVTASLRTLFYPHQVWIRHHSCSHSILYLFFNSSSLPLYMLTSINVGTTWLVHHWIPKPSSFWLMAAALYLLGREERNMDSTPLSKNVTCWMVWTLSQVLVEEQLLTSCLTLEDSLTLRFCFLFQ